jgi:hypothetical protein
VALWQKAFPRSRDEEWERKYLPPPYEPLTAFRGPVSYEWQQEWDKGVNQFRYEDLSNDRSEFSLGLTPRSPRMQYGLDLTRKLYQEIEKLVLSHDGQFILIRHETGPIELTSETVMALNGKYYRWSQLQALEDIDYLTKGFDYYKIPVTLEQWRVGPEDAHLNQHAVDQVMRDLAKQLQGIVASSGKK